jgi:CelD/BcsL family acetyltransferase involved in cellulose biosynthesis
LGRSACCGAVLSLTDDTAALLKLAHDEEYKPLSPGTVLTAMMVRELLNREHVDELDFGRGDDAYKQLRATRRRQRVGVMLVPAFAEG